MASCKSSWIRITPIILLFVNGGFAQPAQWARVTSDRVNLRARPELNAEVVAQVHTGDRLAVISELPDWVEVVPPDTVDVWAYRDFIKDGVVTVKKLNLRAGPGINYSIVGSLSNGDAVTVRGHFGEWLKVAPTNASLWVSREFVELSPAESQPARREELTPLPPSVVAPSAPIVDDITPALAQPPQTPVMPPRSVPGEEPGRAVVSPSVPPDLRLVPLEGQGRSVRYEGILKPAPFLINRPSAFRLVRKEGVQLVTVCYVRGNTAQLQSLLDQSLVIYGREYWVQGVRQPVVLLERIERQSR